MENGKIILAPDLAESLAKVDKFEADFVKAIDGYIEKTGMSMPETLPQLQDGLDAPVFADLDLEPGGITNVIWATSYKFDFSLVKLVILYGDGYPIRKRDVTCYPGLYFVGIPWLHNAKSGLLYGVAKDAAYIAEKIIADNRSTTAAEMEDLPEESWLSHERCCS